MIATSEDTLRAIVHLHMIGGVRQAECDGKLKTDCYQCVNRRDTVGSHHSLCAKPCASVCGSPHGIRKGWFMYPLNYDPVWRTSECEHFEPAGAASSVEQSAMQSAEQ